LHSPCFLLLLSALLPLFLSLLLSRRLLARLLLSRRRLARLLGGLLSCRFCTQFARGPCAKHGTASATPIPRAIDNPANWSFRFIAGYIF